MSKDRPQAPYSSVKGIEWPAISSPNGRIILSILHQFEQSEWWPIDELQAQQYRQLSQLLSHALRNVRYYRERLGGVGINNPEAISPADWGRLPLLRREDIQAADKDLHSKIIPRGHGKVGEVFTSGTTGRPIRALRTGLSNIFWSAFTLRDHLWQGRNFPGKLAVIRNSEKGKDPYPNGTKSRRWGLTDLVYKTGPGVSLNINCTLEEQVDWLQREDPEYLLTHPTNVYRLANLCLEKGIRLEKLRQVQTISEVLRPEVRDVCKAAWGVGVADMYTGREVGYMALQCPEHNHYHVQSEGTYIEVVDSDGDPCQPGEIGRVLVTPLHNFAMPLIRYDIGDYAEVGDPCPCGRTLPVLNKIIGREQDMVTLPNGEQRWTLLSAGNIESFMAIAPVHQYQFVQKDLNTIEVRLAVKRDLTEEEGDKIKDWVAGKLGHPFNVFITIVEDIPRTASGKYQDFVSELKS